MAAAIFAMAGKHMAHPIAETTAPKEPALSPIRVNKFKGLNILGLYFFNVDG